MTEPTRIQPIVLNAPDLGAPEVGGPLDGETIASVYLDGSGLVPKGSCPIKFSEKNYVSVECTTAEQLKAFQERLQTAMDGFLYDANKDPHDREKQVIVTQAQIDRAVEVAKDMIMKTGSVSRAEVFKKAGIVANADEFESIFRWHGFDLNTLTMGGVEDLLETNRTKAAEVFEKNLRGAFANNSKHAMKVKFWDGDGDLATRNDQYWVDGAIFDAALAVIDGNLKALSPSSEPAAAVTATAAAQPPSPLKGEGKEGVVTQVSSPLVGEGKGEGDKSDGGIDLGFWGWSGVVAWTLAGLAALLPSSRRRIVHAFTAQLPPERPASHTSPSPQPSPLEGEGVTRVPSPAVPVPSVAEGGEGQGEGNRGARLDEIGEAWFVDEDGRKGDTADGPPPLPAAEAAEPAQPAAEVVSVRKGAPRKRRYHVGEHPAVSAGEAAAADASGTPSPQPSPIEGEGKRRRGQTRRSAPTKGAIFVGADPSVRPTSARPSTPTSEPKNARPPALAAVRSPMPTTYEGLLGDLNLDALAGNLDAAKLSEAIALGVSGMATADTRYEGLEMQVWVLKEWMEEAKVADSATAMREFLTAYFKNEGGLDARGFVEQTQVKVEKAKAHKAEIRSRFAKVEREARERIESERARRKTGK